MRLTSRLITGHAPTRLFACAWLLLAWPLWGQTSPPPASGFEASYFDNIDLAGDPLLVREESQLAFDWGYESPAAAIPRNGFSARWRGQPFFSEGRYRFQVVADDGVRLWVNGTLVLDAWQPQARTVFQPELELSEGHHLVVVEYFEKTGAAVLACAWQKLTASSEQPPRNQFLAEYFDNRLLQGAPRVRGLEKTIDHDWAHAAPAEGLPSNHFSVRWRGRFSFNQGEYSFVTQADDGVRLWVGDQLVIDAWRDQAETRLEQQLTLSAGEHLITLEYYERGGEARAKLFWYPVRPNEYADSPLGMNLSALSYYSTEWTLVDAMKSAGGWYTHADDTWDTRETLNLDEHGWVRSLPAVDDEATRYRRVGALLLNGTGGQYPAGRYTVFYEGQGSMTFGGDAKHLTELDEPGRMILEVAHPTNAGIHLVITETQPQDYLRNIRVILPGGLCGGDPLAWCSDDTCPDSPCLSLADQHQHFLFHPLFLERLRPFKVLRLMDFLRTNTTDLRDWSQRPQLSDARWNSRDGAPLEVGLALANQLQADVWLNVPIKANDHFVREMARLTRRQLGASQRVYIEYGNEIWNTAFRAGEWVQAQGMAAWPDDSASPFTKRIRWYGTRAAEIADIWRAEWHDAPQRLSTVLGAHAANPWVASQALSWVTTEADLVTGTSPFDSLAIAPYFGGALGKAEYTEQLHSWHASNDPLAPLFQALRTESTPSSVPITRNWVEAHASIATQYGLDLVAYEGGQHLVGIGPTMEDELTNQIFQAANRDPRMADLYRFYLDQWRAAGGQLFCHFLNVGPYSKFGSWGTWEHQNQADSPKAEALLKFIQENPCWWQHSNSP